MTEPKPTSSRTAHLSELDKLRIHLAVEAANDRRETAMVLRFALAAFALLIYLFKG